MLDNHKKNIIKFIGITFVFIISSFSLVNTSGELNKRVEWHYNYINEDKNMGDYEYSKELNLVDYNYYLQKFIYSLVVFSISFVLFVLNLEKRFSITGEIKKWQQKKK